MTAERHETSHTTIARNARAVSRLLCSAGLLCRGMTDAMVWRPKKRSPEPNIYRNPPRPRFIPAPKKARLMAESDRHRLPLHMVLLPSGLEASIQDFKSYKPCDEDWFIRYLPADDRKETALDHRPAYTLVAHGFPEKQDGSWCSIITESLPQNLSAQDSKTVGLRYGAHRMAVFQRGQAASWAATIRTPLTTVEHRVPHDQAAYRRHNHGVREAHYDVLKTSCLLSWSDLEQPLMNCLILQNHQPAIPALKIPISPSQSRDEVDSGPICFTSELIIILYACSKHATEKGY